MKVTIQYHPNKQHNDMPWKFGMVVAEREPDDPKIYNESQFWYLVKKKILSMGYDVVKKLMQKDMHMVDIHEYYIRERKWNFCIRDPRYVYEMIYEDYNKKGRKELTLLVWETDEYDDGLIQKDT